MFKDETTKEMIIRKLGSRKLWLAISGFVSMLLIFFGVAKEVAVQVASLIMAGASVVAYIVSEGWADAANKETDLPIGIIEEISSETEE